MIAKKKKRRKPNRRHPVHADSLLRMAGKHKEQAEFFRKSTSDPDNINTALYAMNEIQSEILEAEGLRVQKIKR